MTQVRKRQVLTRMRYNRVDLVADGANEHADILLAKNRTQGPRTFTVRKAMGQVKCNKCGMMNQKSATKCRFCGSANLAKTLVVVTKTVQNPGKKKAPKNDDATNSTSNASGFTFEDEQYDQDNGENGQALGDAVERSSMNKSRSDAQQSADWFDVQLQKAGDGTEVGSVDNEENGDEHTKEGADPDDDIEEMAETTQASSITRKRPQGYMSTATSSSAPTGMTHKSRMGAQQSLNFGKKRKLKKNAERPGLNSWDYGDQGSQQVAESAEQMYRSESQPNGNDSSHQDSTRSKVLTKARRKKTNRAGLDVMENGNTGIYEHPGVKRNGTGTGHNKYTNRPRTSVAPPPNPLDKSRDGVQKGLPELEALNLGVALAENLGLILKNNRPDMYKTVMEDFLQTANAAASAWFGGSSVTKSKDTAVQAQDVAKRAYDIIAKASPESEMADEVAEGADPDKMDSVATNSMGALKSKTVGHNENEKMEDVVGKNKVYKSADADGDPYEGLSPVVKNQLLRLNELEEMRTHETFITKAREMKHLVGFDEEKVAKQLRDAYEQSDEQGQWLEQTLLAASNGQKDSAVFKQFGMPGAGTSASDDPMARAVAHADSQISKANGGATREQLVTEYMAQHPGEFYQVAKS